MDLPVSEKIESSYLERMLENLAASYKLYWFQGIFEEVKKGNCEMSFRRIISRMIASAWYPVVYFNLNLGVNDKLTDVIQYVHKELGIPRDEKQDKLITFIEESRDSGLNRMIKALTSYVPFRLIRPFYQNEIGELLRQDYTLKEANVNSLIERYNKQDSYKSLYILYQNLKAITVRKDWVEYLTKNALVVEGWLNFKLIIYLQKRNPNVPAIPFKIYPPMERNLTKATAYINALQSRRELTDIYTGHVFTEENIKVYGSRSLDHFIPWSFVLHDEMWNLCPTFKNVNSEKGNKLPDYQKYMDTFLEYQYQMFITGKEYKLIKTNIYEEYLNIQKDLKLIEKGQGRGKELFISSLRNTLEPLYQIAYNQGYGVWSYRDEIG